MTIVSYELMLLIDERKLQLDVPIVSRAVASARKRTVQNGHLTHVKKLIGDYEGLITLPEYDVTKIVAIQGSIEERGGSKPLEKKVNLMDLY